MLNLFEFTTMEKCHYGKWSLWKMTCPCTTMESVTMENVTMENVTMEKDVVPLTSVIFLAVRK